MLDDSTAKSDSLSVDAASLAVNPRPAASTGADLSGPRDDERAKARPLRDACAPKTITVNAADITDAKSFVAFLRDAGFSRGFANRVTNRDAFKVAEPSADEIQQVAEAIKDLASRYAREIER